MLPVTIKNIIFILLLMIAFLPGCEYAARQTVDAPTQSSNYDATIAMLAEALSAKEGGSPAAQANINGFSTLAYSPEHTNSIGTFRTWTEILPSGWAYIRTERMIDGSWFSQAECLSRASGIYPGINENYTTSNAWDNRYVWSEYSGTAQTSTTSTNSSIPGISNVDTIFTYPIHAYGTIVYTDGRSFNYSNCIYRERDIYTFSRVDTTNVQWQLENMTESSYDFRTTVNAQHFEGALSFTQYNKQIEYILCGPSPTQDLGSYPVIEQPSLSQHTYTSVSGNIRDNAGNSIASIRANAQGRLVIVDKYGTEYRFR